MKYIIFILALVISLSTIGIAQTTDSTKIDPASVPATFIPPSKAELDSIRTVMNEKELTAPATIEDLLNMYSLLKYGDMADLKIWTKKKFVELPTVNKKGWAAKFTDFVDQLSVKVDTQQTDINDLVLQYGTFNTRITLTEATLQQHELTTKGLASKLETYQKENDTFHFDVAKAVLDDCKEAKKRLQRKVDELTIKYSQCPSENK